MAAPNLVNVTTITGKTVYFSLANTNATSIVNNAASSGKVFKVNTIMAANIDTTTAYLITLNLYSQDDIGGTAYPIVSTLSVPPNSTTVVLEKNSTIYLEEDKSIGATAGTANKITIVASYEEIS